MIISNMNSKNNDIIGNDWQVWKKSEKDTFLKGFFSSQYTLNQHLEDAIKCLKKIRLNSAEWSEEERAKHLFYRDEVLDLMEHQIKTHKEINL